LGTAGKSLLERGRKSLLPRVVLLGGAAVRKSLMGMELLEVELKVGLVLEVDPKVGPLAVEGKVWPLEVELEVKLELGLASDSLGAE